MSSELLRRAAKVLREHAEAASAGPWTVKSYGHKGSGNYTWELCGAPKSTGGGTVVAESTTDVPSQEIETQQDFAYVALMHPPVALALADLLDAQVPLFAGLTFSPTYDHEVFRLARAILRERP